MKWFRGLCTDILVFALQLRKTSARRSPDEVAVRPVIASNGVPYLQMRFAGTHSTSGWVKEGKEILFYYTAQHLYSIQLQHLLMGALEHEVYTFYHFNVQLCVMQLPTLCQKFISLMRHRELIIFSRFTFQNPAVMDTNCCCNIFVVL